MTTTDNATLYQKAAAGPATVVFDYHQHPDSDPVFFRDFQTGQVLGMVVPQLLTNNECDKILHVLETGKNLFGFDVPRELRVESWENKTAVLSDLLWPRLEHEISKQQQDNTNSKIDACKSISPGWRVLRYQAGEEFPAHQDPMDNARRGPSSMMVSTYSLLLDLTTKSTKQQKRQQLGATRVYYRNNKHEAPYQNCMDIYIPQGWALVLAQHKDIWYAGQAHTDKRATRFVAQAGVLATVPSGMTIDNFRGGANSTFQLGSGLLELLERETNDTGAVVGWGRHFQPKSTMWHKGAPLVTSHESPTKSRQRPSLGLKGESKWSIVNGDTLRQEKMQRRRSSVIMVDPLRHELVLSDTMHTVPKTNNRRASAPALITSKEQQQLLLRKNKRSSMPSSVGGAFRRSSYYPVKPTSNWWEPDFHKGRDDHDETESQTELTEVSYSEHPDDPFQVTLIRL